MKFLFVGAHPDDIEYSCGGTILKLVNEGHKVYMLIMTCGGASPNGTERERKEEQEKACAFIGAEDYLLLDYPDGAIRANAYVIQQMMDILNSIKPDIVFTHYPEDSHQDHREVAAIVKSATRRRYNLFYFDSYSSTNFKANLYVDITPHAVGKKKLIRLFYSQTTKYEERGKDFIQKALLTNKVNGYECKATYAEGFAVDTYMI